MKIIFCLFLYVQVLCSSTDEVEKWGSYEFEASGPSDSTFLNPFVDVEFGAYFTHSSSQHSLKVLGFYDGNGSYKVRFMPNLEGEYTLRTFSNQKELDYLTASFTATPPGPGNRGQAKAYGDHGFRWENGEEYFQCGTTAYVWIHQHSPFPENTLQTLAEHNDTFNKIRITLCPEWFQYLRTEPPLYPFEGKPLTDWDFTRFHVPFWQNYERRLQQLQDIGYIADVILFNYHDAGHWGFDNLGHENDKRYLRYAMARFGSFRHVWWCMANEWDRLNKTMDDWDELFAILEGEDPYQHERSIHQLFKYYNYNLTAINHLSLQIKTVDTLNEVKRLYVRKPYIIDELQYEGDIKEGWGNLSPQELMRRYWAFAVNLAQPGHSETYYKKIGDEEVLWWGKGNVLRGQSPPRIKFFYDYFETLPVSWEMLEAHPEKLGKHIYYLTNIGESGTKNFYLIFWASSDSKAGVNVNLSCEFDHYDVTQIEYYDMKKTLVKTVGCGWFQFTPSSVPYLLDIRGKE